MNLILWVVITALLQLCAYYISEFFINPKFNLIFIVLLSRVKDKLFIDIGSLLIVETLVIFHEVLVFLKKMLGHYLHLLMKFSIVSFDPFILGLLDYSAPPRAILSI